MAATASSSSSAAPSSIGSLSLSTTNYTRGLTPSDLALATTTLPTTSVTIVPLTSIDRVRLLSGIYGPFRPPTPASVPLWVALHLKKRRKAILIPPTWLTVEHLTETLKHETTQPGFAPLPHYWIGVSQTILAQAADDVPNSNRVRALLKDIREARQSKVLAGVGMVNSVHLQMHNIGAHEVAELRGFFGTAFGHLKALRGPGEVEAEEKRQKELDERLAWMLMPPLPTSLADDDVSRREESNELSRGYEESMETNYDEESVLYGAGERRAQPRKSNVSDSGYYSAARAGGSSTSPQPQAPQQERQPPRAPQPDSSDTNRPPRFAVDDDDD